MELRQIEYFLAVVEHDGIGGAAAALGVAQPTVSQALRGLERELGVQLFHRIGRGMVLSAAGRALLGPGRQLLRDVTSVRDHLAASSGELSGTLEISAFPPMAVGRLVELIAQYRRLYPGVTVRLSELRGEHNASATIRDGNSEFVVAHLPLDDSDLAVEVLGEQEYWLAYPAGTLLPEGPVQLTELPHVPMVFVPRGGSVADEIEAGIREAGLSLDLAVVCEHREARLPLVAAGLGGTLIERSMAESAGTSIVARPVVPRFVRPFGVGYRPDRLSPAGQAFVNLIRGSTNDGATD
ncbi:MAG: LysR family transcriptional regulator [Rhodococcus sp.]|nr:LysR family transcriptional regulator [Rhodococcus sp. (in: high G+C Gram-positive bacteria)]